MIIQKTKLKSYLGHTIYANWFKGLKDQTPNQIIITIHGFGSNKNSGTILELANSLTQNNVAILSFDLISHGESTEAKEKFRVQNFVSDIHKVVNYVHKKYPNIPVSIFASSFGGFLTLLYTSTHKTNLHKIILRAPAVNMAKNVEQFIYQHSQTTIEEFKKNGAIFGFDKQMHIPYDFVLDLKEIDLFNKFNNKYNLNYFVIQGTEDDVVLTPDVLEFFKKLEKNAKVQLIEGADHLFKKPGEMDKIIQFTRNYLQVNN